MDELDRALATLAAADPMEVLRRGWHVQKRHYYSTLNDPFWLRDNQDLWRPPLVPADIDWDIPGQLRTAAELGAFAPELADIPKAEPPECKEQGRALYHWHNPFFNSADGIVWYGLVRSRKPARVVEVGCGWSSLLLARALEQNARDAGAPSTQVTQVEPFPNERVFAMLPPHWAHHRVPIQRAPLEPFDALRAGDVLFYDGSHTAHVASDVCWMLFRILPRLRAGVLIHFHDIFFPRDYPPSWIFDRLQTWNEQYLVQALLMHSRAYRVVAANALLAELHAPEVRALYHNIQPAFGSSLWIEKTKDPDPERAAQAADLTARCALATPKSHRDPACWATGA